MALSGKQVRQLRALAHHLNPVIYVGRGDVNDGVVQQTEECLEAHELIKCALQDGSNLTVREAASELAERTGADVVQIIGHRFSLYRASSRDDIERIKFN